MSGDQWAEIDEWSLGWGRVGIHGAVILMSLPDFTHSFALTIEIGV